MNNDLLERLRDALERAREPRATAQHYPGGLAGGLSPEDHQRLSEWQVRSAEARSEIVATLPDLLSAFEQQEREMEAMRGALEPFAHFVSQFERAPMNLADEVYTIHGGTEFEASLRLSDCRKARTALKGDRR